jgi:glucose/arabinose dehydrogenase
VRGIRDSADRAREPGPVRRWVLVAAVVTTGCGATSAGVTVASAPPPTIATPQQTSVTPAPPTTASSSSLVPHVDRSTASTFPVVLPDPPPSVHQLSGVALRAEVVAPVADAVAIAWRAGDPAPYVAGQLGQIWRVDPAAGAQLVANFGDRVSSGSERGLLGIAFGPDGRMYIDYTDTAGDVVVSSFDVPRTNPDPATERLVLWNDQPGFGHNAGHLLFDEDGNLFVSIGDGGASNGRDAQDPAKLLGAILRVRPKLDGPGYDVPSDNPFVGHANVRPEKWVYGLRNPWRFSIDQPTGELWIGDVGNDRFEEINRIPSGQAGLNMGWYWFEGFDQRRSDAPTGLTPPVHAYSHDEGAAVIGGHVYRGDDLPGLRGAYVFGDLTGPIWALGADGVVRLSVEVRGLSSFGLGPDDELWATSIYEGVVRFVPA